MIHLDLIDCLRETAFRLVVKDSYLPKHPEECFLNPPCGCANPGKELKCEECPHLEACLSQFKTVKSSQKSRIQKSKISVKSSL
jgi:hypothetical protein